MKKLLILTLLGFAATTGLCSTFSSDGNLDFPDEVFTDGILVQAENLGNPTKTLAGMGGDFPWAAYYTNTTQNGVWFDDPVDGAKYDNSYDAEANDVVKNVISSGLQSGWNGSVTITLEDLEAGSDYRIQVLVGPSWSWCGYDLILPVDEDGNSFLDSGGNDGATGATADIIRGTWTAQAAEETVEIDFNDGDGSQGFVMGFVLHKMVPETSTAHNPAPENGAANQETDLTLSWSKALDQETSLPRTDITDHFVYVHTEPNMPAGGLTPTTVADSGGTFTTYSPSGLSLNTDYYWRVDESVNGSAAGDPETITGPWWKFTTKSGAPTVTMQPEPRYYTAPGDDTAITFEHKDVTSFQWYKYVDGVSDTALSDGADYAGTTTDTLTILDTQLADEGDYYCVISGNGPDAQTNNAKVWTERLWAYYQFEGDLTDSSLSGYDLTASQPTYQFGTGLGGGSALETTLEGDNATYYFDPTETLDQYTVMMWAKAADAEAIGDYDAVINNGDFQLGYYNGDVAGVEEISEWFHVALVYDGEFSRVFGNGTLNNENENFEGDFEKIQILHNRAESNTFIGLADEVKIYNYALSDEEIAQEYIDVAGGTTCLYPIQYDVNGDCKITLVDFVQYALEWNNCGLYPASACSE
ncbi:LamG-like jellyroll fold domain-containing protein [Sedimentisphaera salicampi]|uniref:Ig-like domain-containing protein n=1 Tax=Sedimentisphaera salicampi TaxID=1941349 RepID=A0A1W6LL92_9BACT|nr:LamG-like jellyroll fold domain-containing protein [Sedimentisphaera salicampi]ARN56526.1 hypothetical protein STSP1_00909 [Sedimentisphaera salicampi]